MKLAGTHIFARLFKSEAKVSVSTDEIASTGNDWLNKWQGEGVIDTSDEIISKVAPARLKGELVDVIDAYKLYQVMRKRDAKFKSLIGTRKRALLSKEIRVVPNSYDPDEDRARDVAEFMQAVIDQIHNFRRDLREMLDAIPVGFSVSELIWEQKVVTYAGGKRVAWVCTDLRQRRTGRFGFTKDSEMRYVPEPGSDEALPPMKFMLCSHEPEHEDPRGLSESSEVFWYWFFKHQTVRDQMVFHDKFGMPTAVATYPPGTDKKVQQELLNLVRKFQTEYAAVYPKNVEVKLIESTRNGASASFQASIDYWDRCMSEAILGQSLATSQSTTGTGALAMSQVHNEVRQEVVEADSEELEGWVNTQFMRWHTDLNFGVDVPAPRLMVAARTRNLGADADLDSKLVSMGLPLSKTEMYKHYGKAAPADDDDAITGKPVLSALMGGWAGEDKPKPDSKKKPDPKETDPDEGDDDEEELKGVKKKAHQPGCLKFAVAPEALTEAKRQRGEMDIVLGRMVDQGTVAVGELLAAVTAESAAATDVWDLSVRLFRLMSSDDRGKKLGEALWRAKIGGYLMAAAQVQRYAYEILAAEFDADQNSMRTEARTFVGKLTRSVKYSAMDLLADYEPLDPDEAVKWFEGLTPLTSDDLDNLPTQAQGNSFTVAEIEEKAILEEIQGWLADSVKTGESLQTWNKELPGKLAELGVDPLKPHRVEEIFRTNVARAYGAGRTKALRNPEIEGAFPLWQRIAIDDDRTRETHRAMNGFAAPPDDVVWLSWNAPNDYNCRCGVIPLSRRQIETRKVEVTLSVKMDDGTEVDPRTLPTNSAFKGLGFN